MSASLRWILHTLICPDPIGVAWCCTTQSTGTFEQGWTGLWVLPGVDGQCKPLRRHPKANDERPDSPRRDQENSTNSHIPKALTCHGMGSSEPALGTQQCSHHGVPILPLDVRLIDSNGHMCDGEVRVTGREVVDERVSMIKWAWRR